MRAEILSAPVRLTNSATRTPPTTDNRQRLAFSMMKGVALLLVGAGMAQAQTACTSDSNGDGRVGVDGGHPRVAACCAAALCGPAYWRAERLTTLCACPDCVQTS